MTWKHFETQMDDCDVQVWGSKTLCRVVIRGEHGDHELAACHVSEDGKVLIFDLGQPVPE